jgi:hypothetical protein
MSTSIRQLLISDCGSLLTESLHSSALIMNSFGQYDALTRIYAIVQELEICTRLLRNFSKGLCEEPWINSTGDHEVSHSSSTQELVVNVQ